MKAYSFYDKVSGLFTGRVFIGDEESLSVNTPESSMAIEGQFDSMSKKVDVKTGKVVSYKPPSPGDNEFEKFSWDAVSLRWKSNPTNASMARDARAKRSGLLSASDWTQLADVELEEESKKAWAVYRKALRDISKQAGFPTSISWPIPPDL